MTCFRPVGWRSAGLPLRRVHGHDRSWIRSDTWETCGDWRCRLAVGWRSAGWLWTTGHGDCSQPPRLAAQFAKPGGNDAGQWAAPPRDWIAHRVESVAAWLLSTAWSGGGRVQQYLGPDRPSACHDDGWVACIERDGLADRLETPSASLFIYAGPAEDIHPPDDCEGVYCFVDPPYSGDGTRKITGYAADMPRDVVLDVLQRWHDAGAMVCCSECVGLADGLRGDWWEVDITGARVGQRRTFGATPEWITLNRKPAYRPATQQGLF